MTAPRRAPSAQATRALISIGLSAVALASLPACAHTTESTPQRTRPATAAAGANDADDATEATEAAQEDTRRLSATATYQDLVDSIRTLDARAEHVSPQACLLGGGPLTPFRLEAELAAAIHPIPQTPADLDVRLEDPRERISVLTRWGRHGEGSVAVVALTASPPPGPGHIAVVALGNEGARLRRTEAAVVEAHAGPFPVSHLHEHLPVVLEGAAGVVFTAEADLSLATLRAALETLPPTAPPVMLGLVLAEGVRLPATPAPATSDRGMCVNGSLPAAQEGHVLGDLSTDAIRASIRNMAEGAGRCFEYAQGDAARGGRLRVLTRIGPQGRVLEACATEDELGDATLRACMLGVVEALVFPAPTGGHYVDVALPIRLSPDASLRQRPLCDAGR